MKSAAICGKPVLVSNQNAMLVRDDGNTVASKSCDSLRHATAPEHQLCM